MLSDYSPGDDVKNFEQAKALDKINERLPPSRWTGGLGDGNAVNHAAAAASFAGTSSATVNPPHHSGSSPSSSRGGGAPLTNSPSNPATVDVQVTGPSGPNGPLSGPGASSSGSKSGKK